MPEGSTDESDEEGLPDEGEEDPKRVDIVPIDKQAIHEELKRSRVRNTVRVKSQLP